MVDGSSGGGSLFDFAKMMVSFLYQTTMKSGKAQMHEVEVKKLKIKNKRELPGHDQH